MRLGTENTTRSLRPVGCRNHTTVLLPGPIPNTLFADPEGSLTKGSREFTVQFPIAVFRPFIE